VEGGNVKLAAADKRGKKAVIALLRAGDCFGEGCLIPKSFCNYTATAVHAAKVGRMSGRKLLACLREEPAFAKAFTTHLIMRIEKSGDDLADQLLNSSEQRLARLLLQLSDFGKTKKMSTVDVMIDQGTLAQVVGTTRSRVSHFLNKFREKGYIDYNGNLRVHKSLATFLLDRSNKADF
jgi:CRP/FNR family cyclic AMP-dependent transcriptional regulator